MRNEVNMGYVRFFISITQPLNWPGLDEVITIIRKHHAANLLRDPRYLNEVRNDKDLLWLHRDDLGPKADGIANNEFDHIFDHMFGIGAN